MKRRILLLSGGLDSAGALLKTLYTKKPDEVVRILHVDYIQSALSKPQRVAVRELLLHVPDWDIYTCKTLDRVLHEPIDVCTKAMQAFGTGNFLEGDEKEENATSLELIVGYEYEEFDTATIDELNAAVQLVRSAFISVGVGILPTTVVSPVKDMDKGVIKEFIGDSTFWSCREPLLEWPNIYVPCGICHTCEQLHSHGIEHPSVKPDYSTILQKGGI